MPSPVTPSSAPPAGRPSWSDASAPVTVRFALGSALAVTAAHLALWVHTAARRHEAFGEVLQRWDSGHYTAIARDGYAGQLWVFYPGYPMSVRAVAALLHTQQVPWVGFGLSLLVLVGVVVAMARSAQRPGLPTGLTPRTRLGFLFFLLTPAGYVFHSHHTEALFLALSFGAFFFAGTRRPALAGAFAAACALTRNQGVFVGLAAALLAASLEETTARRARALLLTGGLALSGVVGFLTFQVLASGSAFTFLAAQGGWAHVDSPAGALKTLVFGNPWQSTDGQNLLRYGAWWLCVAGSAWLSRRCWPLGLYALLCFLVQLPQGELVNTLRFAAPVFPLFFFVGDEAAQRPRWLQAAALVLLALVNLDTARRYAEGLWAY